MASENKLKIKVKKTGDKTYLEGAAEKGDEKKKWDIKIERDQQEITFDKDEDGKISENKLKIKIAECGKNNWSDAEAAVKYNKSIWRKTFELVPEIEQTGKRTELKEINKKLGTDKHSYNWGIYVVVVVVIMAISGFIWWWVASSKKEDKEEESL